VGGEVAQARARMQRWGTIKMRGIVRRKGGGGGLNGRTVKGKGEGRILGGEIFVWGGQRAEFERKWGTS